MESKKELENFLYPTLPAPFGLIQKVWAKKDKKVLFWQPGIEKEDGESYLSRLHLLKHAELVGYTGKVYEKEAVYSSGDYLLFWIGIDVDNVTLDPAFYSGILPTLRRIVPDGCLRISTGGHGLHIIHRIIPIKMTGNCSRIVEEWQKETVAAISSIGLNVCRFDNRAFFLLGGKNEWIVKSETILDLKVPETFSSSVSERQRGREKIEIEFVSPRILKFLEGLREKKVRIAKGENGYIPSIQGVWVKEVKEAIPSLPPKTRGGFKFVTKSPCKSTEWHCNGWLIISPNFLAIRGFADSENCFELNDMEWDSEGGF